MYTMVLCIHYTYYSTRCILYIWYTVYHYIYYNHVILIISILPNYTTKVLDYSLAMGSTYKSPIEIRGLAGMTPKDFDLVIYTRVLYL